MARLNCRFYLNIEVSFMVSWRAYVTPMLTISGTEEACLGRTCHLTECASIILTSDIGILSVRRIFTVEVFGPTGPRTAMGGFRRLCLIFTQGLDMNYLLACIIYPKAHH